jgi:hypothetical protein
MKAKLIITAALFVLTAGVTRAQNQTKTTCTTNGNQTTCTSTTGEQPGHEIGRAIGSVIGNRILRHRINKFCKKHPDGWFQPDGEQRIECRDWNASK